MTAPAYVRIELADPADAEIIIGNLPAAIRNDLFAGPHIDLDGNLAVPEAVADIARAVAADIEGHRATAWPVETVHIAWLKAALAEAGKLEAVNAAVAKAGPVQAALWEYATTINASDKDVVAIAAAMKLDLPALFRRADALRKMPR